MSVSAITPASPIQTQRAQPQPLMVMDDGHMVPGGPSDRSGDDKFKFSDLIALVNPLQHLPIIGPLYRKLTGDEPHPAVKVVGGLIFGGPLGLVNATLNHVFEQTTGKTMVDAAIDLLNGKGETATAIADAGAPRRLIPADGVAAQEPAAGDPAQAASTTPTNDPARRAVPAAAAAPTASAAPASPPTQSAATPAATNALANGASTNGAWAGARQTGGRDLSWYQANAGARMPATVSSATGTHAPSVPRSAGPSYLPGAVAGPVGSTPGANGAPATAAMDFATRLSQGLQRYEALRQQNARSAATIDRFE